MKYEILTCCSKDNVSSINFSCKNWLMSDVYRINIYTDFDPNNNNITKSFFGNINFVYKNDNTNSKLNILMCLKDFLQTNNITNLLILDLDCVIFDNLTNVFKNKFDIALTLNDNNNINKNIMFVKNTNELKLLIDNWIYFEYLNSFYKPNINDSLFKNTKANILKLDNNIYNNSPKTSSIGSLKLWKQNIIHHKNKIKILHFSNNIWKSRTSVNNILEAL